MELKAGQKIIIPMEFEIDSILENKQGIEIYISHRIQYKKYEGNIISFCFDKKYLEALINPT